LARDLTDYEGYKPLDLLCKAPVQPILILGISYL
jgi:hypothetical protein